MGQFARSRRGSSELVHEVDGTYDYHLTSEQWLCRFRQLLRSAGGARIFSRVLPTMLEHPIQAATMVLCMLVSELWNWQFRGPNPPTRLLRQTWAYQG